MPGSILDQDPEQRERARLQDLRQATITGITQEQGATFEPRVEQRIVDEGGKPAPTSEQAVQSETPKDALDKSSLDVTEQASTRNADASGSRNKAESEVRAEDAKALTDAVAPIDRANDDTVAKGQADRASRVDDMRATFAEGSVTRATGEDKMAEAKELYGEKAQRTYRADSEVVTGTIDRDQVTFRMYTPKPENQPAGESREGDGRSGAGAEKVISHPIQEQAGPAPEGQSHGSAEAGKKVWSSPADDPVALSKMSAAELKEKGLTPEGFKERYALPEAPTSIADRHHPKGQQLSIGEAAENDMGKGGGPQVEAKGARTGERNTPGVDWNQTTETWDLRPSAAFNRSSNPKEYGLDGQAKSGESIDQKSQGDNAPGDKSQGDKAQQPADAQARESAQPWPGSPAGEEQQKGSAETRAAAGNQPAAEKPSQGQAQTVAMPDPEASQAVPRSSGPTPAVQPPSDSGSPQQQTPSGRKDEDHDR